MNDTPAVMPHRGVLVLVFGILGIFLSCIIFSIIAWVLGKGDLEKMRAGQMDPSGESMTKVGMILGIVGTALFLLGVVVSILLFGFMGVGVAAAAGSGVQ